MIKYWLLCMFSICILNVAAQNKTLNSRWIAYSQEVWDGSAYYESDSSDMSYSGNRGGYYNSGLSGVRVKYDQRNYYDSTATGWIVNMIHQAVYDSKDSLVEYVMKNWNGTAYRNTHRDVYVYNANGILTQERDEHWDTLANAWNPQSQYDYTYDASGNLILSVRRFRPLSEPLMDTFDRHTYTYNTAGKELTHIEERWDSTGWRNLYSTTSTYNSANLLINLVKEKWSGGAWANNSRAAKTYDANGNMLTTISEAWDGANWLVSYRETNTYDTNNNLLTQEIEQQSFPAASITRSSLTYDAQNNMISLLRERDSSGIWINLHLDEYTYDANGNVLTDEKMRWIAGNWRFWEGKTYTYNTYGQVLTTTHEDWNGTARDNSYREQYYYELYGEEDSTVAINELPIIESRVLPNPFTVNVAIELNVTQSGAHTLDVFNINGQRIFTETRYLPAGQQHLLWEGEAATSGVYIYRVTSSAGVAQGRVVKR